jgi:hypothetical protein
VVSVFDISWANFLKLMVYEKLGEITPRKDLEDSISDANVCNTKRILVAIKLRTTRNIVRLPANLDSQGLRV